MMYKHCFTVNSTIKICFKNKVYKRCYKLTLRCKKLKMLNKCVWYTEGCNLPSGRAPRDHIKSIKVKKV